MSHLSLRVSIMGPVQPFSFLGSFMVRVVTWFLVLLSTNLTVVCQGIETDM